MRRIPDGNNISHETDFGNGTATKGRASTLGVMRQFVHNGECTVNVLTVKPGMRLSLQSHTARAELWIILDDSARIQVGDEIRDYKSGDEVWIPVYEKHRLSNVGTEPIRVLEITFGNWQQEDIERFEDDFSRPAVGE